MAEGGYEENQMEERGQDNDGFDEDEEYVFPEEYDSHEGKFTDKQIYNKIFKNKGGETVSKEKYKDSFIIEYSNIDIDFGQKARVASAKLFHKRYPNMDVHAARDAGRVMFGIRQDDVPVVKLFKFDKEERNKPYVINSSDFPQEIKNILEPKERDPLVHPDQHVDNEDGVGIPTSTTSTHVEPRQHTAEMSFGGGNVVQGSIAEEGLVKSESKTRSATKETSFENPSFEPVVVDERTRLLADEEDHSVLKEIKRKFPRFKPSKATNFIFGEDELGNVYVELKRKGGRRHSLYNADGNLNEKLPKSITDGLGPPAEEIVVNNEVEILGIDDILNEMDNELSFDLTGNVDERPNTSVERTKLIERRDELEHENEAIQERMTMKERVKMIFEKYGVTAIGIITAVGTVIGVVVSNLKSGLAKVAKGVGNGLKELGKKLAQLLPGMIGAIAKYVFNTAGEVVGYLAKNTWLLIVAAVVYAVEQFKKKNK